MKKNNILPMIFAGVIITAMPQSISNHNLAFAQKTNESSTTASSGTLSDNNSGKVETGEADVKNLKNGKYSVPVNLTNFYTGGALYG